MRDHTSLRRWQVARAVTMDVFQLSVRHWTPPAGAAFAQLQRSALSVQLKVAEGYTWSPGLRWQHHLRIAYGSAVETTDVLEPLRDVRAVPNDQLNALIAESRRAQALVLALLKSTRLAAKRP
jgi:four helix bundle protein